MSSFRLRTPSSDSRASSSKVRTFEHAAIATNTPVCSRIGLDILRKGGSVADAAIAVLLGEGVCCPQSMGVGGGFLLTIYCREKQTVEYLNARECAPGNAHKDMYGKQTKHDITESGLAAAVPAELKGYWELHQRYGQLKWEELFAPTIEMCRSGIRVTKYTSNALYRMNGAIVRSPTLRSLLYNIKTGCLLKEGEHMLRKELAETLTLVAQNGPDVLYDGPLTKQFLKDIQNEGGIITKEDLKNYKPKWGQAITLDLPGNLEIHSVPPPGAGSVLFTILESLSQLLTEDPVLLWHRLIEVWKFAFGIKGKLGGPSLKNKQDQFKYTSKHTNQIISSIDDSRTYQDFNHYNAKSKDVEDKGTCHVCVLAPNGDAISVTSSINYGLGACFVSPSTGIILNNQMMDFSIPYYFPWDSNPSNFIEPYKQPMSSMCPSIVVDKATKSVRLIIGGAGGFRIITSTSQVLMRNLWLNEDLFSSVAKPRLHHILYPMEVNFEEPFDVDVLKGLKKKGHVLRLVRVLVQTEKGAMVPVLPSVNAVSVEGGKIFAVGDPRRFASGGGF